RLLREDDAVRSAGEVAVRPVHRDIGRVVDERHAEHRALPLELALDLDPEPVLDDAERGDGPFLLTDLLPKSHFGTSPTRIALRGSQTPRGSRCQTGADACRRREAARGGEGSTEPRSAEVPASPAPEQEMALGCPRRDPGSRIGPTVWRARPRRRGSC